MFNEYPSSLANVKPCCQAIFHFSALFSWGRSRSVVYCLGMKSEKILDHIEQKFAELEAIKEAVKELKASSNQIATSIHSSSICIGEIRLDVDFSNALSNLFDLIN